MTFENLLKLSDNEPRCEYVRAKKQSNRNQMKIINTLRIRNMINSAIQIHGKESIKEQIPYYEQEGITYFFPEQKPYNPTICGHIEWLMLAHISSRSPIAVDITLLKDIVQDDHIEFVKKEQTIEKKIDSNILNWDYITEDTILTHLPDIWVPNGEKELQIAVGDMPKNDTEAILLTNLTSHLIIGDYITENKTFTDVFYSPNHTGEMPKAIILNDIAGIKNSQLESTLQNESVYYTKRQNISLEADNVITEDKTGINLDLSTIWTAKFKEIIEDAIEDSKQQENFTPTLTKIYKVPCSIVATIREKNETIGLNVLYNTVILFDGKLILYDDKTKDENRTEITQIFLENGIPAIITEETIDLTPFLIENQNIGEQDYKTKANKVL